ncbi:MAG: TetR/AcrR family transcriptional regulator [Gemmatimonadaceae bacterium]
MVSALPPPSSREPGRRTRSDASERILRAAVRCIVNSGATDLTLNEVAEEAAVSKGLIHYHFHDKDTLLARVVEYMARSMVARESAALAKSVPRHAIEDLWTWLSGELGRRHIRVLIELAEWRSPLIQGSIRVAALARRESAAASADRLFGLLGLKPRVPVELLAGVIVAFIDGLAVSASMDADQNARVSFDVFWLSLLSIAE